MPSDKIILLLLLLVAGLSLVQWVWNALSDRRKARQGDQLAEEVRSQMLAFRERLYREALAQGAEDEVTGAFIETGRELVSQFLAAYPDGMVRRFYTDGKSLTLAPGSPDSLRLALEPVGAAAKALVATAASFREELPTQEMSPVLPEPGRVRLVLLTSRGARMAEESEAALQSQSSRFFPIYRAARELEIAISHAQYTQLRSVNRPQ
jgi:hypothetical protein